MAKCQLGTLPSWCFKFQNWELDLYVQLYCGNLKKCDDLASSQFGDLPNLPNVVGYRFGNLPFSIPVVIKSSCRFDNLIYLEVKVVNLALFTFTTLYPSYLRLMRNHRSLFCSQTESYQFGNFHLPLEIGKLSKWQLAGNPTLFGKLPFFPPTKTIIFIAAQRQKETNMNFMNNTAPIIIIGIDHGYGNIKTAHCCFKTGVAAYDKEPTFKSNLLIYEGKYYLIGEEHKEFISDKMTDGDYYILTLAAVARELNIRRLTSARVHLAAGLPLTWVSEQKDSFKAYLLQNESADFNFKGVDYHVDFVGADIFPQGFSAVADRLREFKGINMLCDIGNGTMNVMYINECRPLAKKCFTEKYGTNQCMLAVRENLMKQFGVSVDESVLERVIRHGTADISERYLTAIRETAAEYAAGIFRRLREHEYDPELMRLYVVGGGSCILKNFGDYNKDRVIINDDICATAKGYELLAEQKLHKKGGIV